MGDVVRLVPRTQGWGQGEAICAACGTTWQQVAPAGEHDFECPRCGCMKGRYRYAFDAPLEARVCQCGNNTFYLLIRGAMCPACGLASQSET